MFRFAPLLALGMVSCAALTTWPDGPAREASVRFHAERLDTADGLASLCVGPDGHVYAGTYTGSLWRYRIDPTNGRSRQRDLVLSLPGRRILGLTFDGDGHLWMTHDAHGGESFPDPMSFTGTLSRFDLPDTTECRIITGCPVGAHPLTSPNFGPDGRLYLSCGATTMAGGGTKTRRETPLSASILALDLSKLDASKLPLDVRPGGYDPCAPGAPLTVYAHGVREAFDMCWHTNGRLYAGVNMNDREESTPSRPGLPALFKPQPDEQLLRIEPGVYYGHPNPSIGKYVLLGGNPTQDRDPWEVPRFPVGVQPEPDFRPNLLIYNLAKVGGDSADGCVEYRHPGPWQGRLLLCFHTRRRCIGSFAFSPDGTSVTDFEVVRDAQGHEIKFAAPLDIATDACGRLYVADFPAKCNAGGLWLLTPVR